MHTMTMRTDVDNVLGLPFSTFIPCQKCWDEHREKVGMKYLIYIEEVGGKR